jgi:two-component system sensor histidine kinase YesM
MSVERKGPVKYQDYLRMLFAAGGAVIVAMFLLVVVVFLVSKQLLVVNVNRDCNEAVRGSFRSLYGAYEDGLRQLAASEEVAMALSGEATPAHRLLLDFSRGKELRCYYSLFNQDEELVLSSLYQPNREICQESIALHSAMDQLRQSPLSVVCGVSDRDYREGQETFYHFAAAVRREGQVVGYLVLEPRREDAGKLLESVPVDLVVIVDGLDNIVFSTLPSVGTYAEKYAAEKFHPDYTASDQILLWGRPYYITTGSGGFGYQIYTMTALSLQQSSFLYGTLMLGLVSVLLLLALIPISRTIIRRNKSALDNLLYAVDQCAAGNISYRIHAQTFDEFQILYDRFNAMMSQMQSLIQNNQELAERKRWMEVSHLEGQFNPHFVFNIMESLKYVIVIDPPTASRMVVAFAKLMRYGINYGRAEVALRTDLEYIETYLMLQKMRYGDRLEYHIDVEEDLLDCRVPKLIIQPLVENSIVHNAEHRQVMEVAVTGRRTPQGIRLEISDNGLGIPPGKLNELRTLLENKNASTSHIGLYNVHRTIQLLYGEEYGLEIQSIYNRGTVIIADLPYREGEEDV